MRPFSKLLVDVDPLAPRHPALQQALDLAGRCGAAVTIVDVLAEVPSRARSFVTPQVEEEIVAHRARELARLAASADGRLSTAVLRGRPATALVHEVLDGGYDLVVRSHDRDLSGGDRPFGAVDMELLRQCPCPVWLVGPEGAHHPRRVLAAVHANPDDPAEQALNARILELAGGFAGVERAGLTVLQAWSVFGESTLRGRLADSDLAALRAEARRTAADDLAALLAAFGDSIGGIVVALENGEPDDVIPAYLRSHAIDLVVMGTVVRTGIAGLLMGNTAERVLRRLRGSVLAVKPTGFESPVAAARGRGARP
jgi:universal stress protein E